MPERILKVPAALWKRLVTQHPGMVITVLSFMLLIALGIAVAGWTAARNAERRVTQVEVSQAAEIAAQERGEKIAQVATCFNSANGRPLLTTVLRALAGREFDPAVREAFNQLITQYEEASSPGITGTPTHEKCRALAKRYGIDPGLFDPTS